MISVLREPWNQLAGRRVWARGWGQSSTRFFTLLLGATVRQGALPPAVSLPGVALRRFTIQLTVKERDLKECCPFRWSICRS